MLCGVSVHQVKSHRSVDITTQGARLEPEFLFVWVSAERVREHDPRNVTPTRQIGTISPYSAIVKNTTCTVAEQHHSFIGIGIAVVTVVPHTCE